MLSGDSKVLALPGVGVQVSPTLTTTLTSHYHQAQISIEAAFAESYRVSSPARVVRKSWYISYKPVFDFVLALWLLIITSPLTLIAALLVKLTSRGPAFYSQRRVGFRGKLFTIFKLRTMVVDSESETGAVWAKKGDTRITPIGRVLRATHVDEFPQLVNILLGQMSLIGPRPERPEIVDYLQQKIDGYTDRLQVRPGITGLAQVQLPPDVDLAGVKRKLVCDVHYIKNFAAGLDLRILLCTGFLLIGIPLSVSRRLLYIPEPLKAKNSFV